MEESSSRSSSSLSVHFDASEEETEEENVMIYNNPSENVSEIPSDYPLYTHKEEEMNASVIPSDDYTVFAYVEPSAPDISLMKQPLSPPSSSSSSSSSSSNEETKEENIGLEYFIPSAPAVQPSAPFLPPWFVRKLLRQPPFNPLEFGILNNGLTYYVKHVEGSKELIDLRLIVKAGSVYENDEEHGVACLLEHLLYVPDLFHLLGVDVVLEYSHTSHDFTTYNFLVDCKHAKPVIKIMARIAQKLKFGQLTFEKRKKSVLEFITFCSQDEEKIRLQAFRSRLYKGTKYARPICGTAESVQGLSAATAEKFYRKWYIPSNMGVIAVGDMTDTQLQNIVKWIKHYFKKKEKAVPQILEFPFQRCDVPRLFAYVDSAVAKSEVHFTFMSKKMRLESLDDVFIHFQHKILVEVLLTRLRRKFSRNKWENDQEQTQMCNKNMIWVDCEGPKTIKILETFLAEITQMSIHGIEEDELTQGKQSVLNMLHAQLYYHSISAVHLLGDYTIHFLYDDTFGALDTPFLDNEIENIQIKDIRSCCQMFFRDNDLSVIVIQSQAYVTEENMRNSLQRISDMKGKGCLLHCCGDEEETSTAEIFEELEPRGIVKRVECSSIGATELILSNGMHVSYKYSELDDEVCLRGFAYGGLSEVPETDFLSCSMSGPIAEEILISSFKKHLLCEKVQFHMIIDEYTRGFKAHFSSADVGVVLQMVYLLFTSELKPEKEQLQAIVDKISKSLSPQLQESRSPQWYLLYYILEEILREINSSGSHIYKMKTIEDLSLVDLEKAWNYCSNCFKDPSSFRVVLVGKFDRVAIDWLLSRFLGGIPKPSTSLMSYQRENLTEAAYRFPQTVITKEVSMAMSRAKGMICSISFAFCLDYEQLEEEKYLLGLMKMMLRARVVRMVGLYGINESHVKVVSFAPVGERLLNGTKSGTISFYICLTDTELSQRVIDAVVNGIDKLIKSGPSQNLVQRALAGVQWDVKPKTTMSLLRQMMIVYLSNVYHGDFDLAYRELCDSRTRVREVYNANVAKTTFRRILSYPRRVHTVVKLTY